MRAAAVAARRNPARPWGSRRRLQPPPPPASLTGAAARARADRRGDRVLATGEALRDVSVTRDAAGALSFRFTRALQGSTSSPERNASASLHPRAGPAPFVWALFPSWTVATTLAHPVHDDMHTRWSHAPTLLDLQRGTAAPGGGVERAVVAHAVLMALAWGLLHPAAAAAARHLKPLGGPSFFYAHLGLNALGFIFTCAGFGTIYQHIRADEGPAVRHFDGGFHTKLGLAVFILAWFQPLGGVLRPAAPRDGDKPSAARRLWDTGHRAGGRLLIGMALLAALTGIAMVGDHGASRSAVGAGLALWVLWCVVGLAGGFAGLELLRRRREAAPGGGAAAGYARAVA